MAGKADLVNSIVDSFGATSDDGEDDAAYASLDAAVVAGEPAERGGGWIADG
jgi:hypothetical protein